MHREKVPFPMDFTLGGITIERSLLQFVKALSPIDDTLLESVMFCKAMHPSNELLPIVLIVSGMITEDKEDKR